MSGGGQGSGGNEGVGLQRGQGRPHHHREIWEALRAPKLQKLWDDTVPLSGHCSLHFSFKLITVDS